MEGNAEPVGGKAAQLDGLVASCAWVEPEERGQGFSPGPADRDDGVTDQRFDLGGGWWSARCVAPELAAGFVEVRGRFGVQPGDAALAQLLQFTNKIFE